ncbi:hypothetical protein CSB45_14150 [candidate division KSB3 bacterium]|uniref:DUF4279 domain-containing protein n=1 Tax=candidate division KSB3 bacterium TaxID=2044937 RepID=A0A2G6E291_9BACT|nr:MAG: hypothetical protein CSB45_14150 [candidate division KSB3 bacterium]PIE28468.1 MAG: hypothetical protein CSA57_13795 [candidate division KSB3 bacterium]
MKADQNHIAIRLEGFSCSPEELTEKIGLKPTWVALKNQEYHIGTADNRITKKYKTNCWQFRVDKEDQSWVSDQVREFLEEHIRPRKKQIKQVVSSCEGELSIVHYIFEGCNPGLHFGKEEIELLSETGLELDIDIYCLAAD